MLTTNVVCSRVAPVPFLVVFRFSLKSGVIVMGANWEPNARGMTLVEVLIATIVVSVAAVGVLSYEYHAASQVKMARAYAGAVRLGDFLLEDWKANSGASSYALGYNGMPSPLTLGMGFIKTHNMVYQIEKNNIPMQIQLLRLDGYAYHKLIPLQVIVSWRNDFLAPPSSAELNDTVLMTSVVLSTYARVDQAGG